MLQTHRSGVASIR